MKRTLPIACGCLLAGLMSGLLLASTFAGFGPVKLECGGFEFSRAITVAATPERAYDLFTGDISGWWDHHLSEKPRRLSIEPRPGGGFVEIFDDEGNGALHATVNVADRGRLLRFTGPLGLTGHAISLVNTIEFTATGEGQTRVKLTCRAAGEMRDGWIEAVEQTWGHFLLEQYQPYVAAHAGAH